LILNIYYFFGGFNLELSVASFLGNLRMMEEMLNKLTHEYELYFAGGRKYPPTQEHKELEKAVRFYGRVTLPSTQQQYLFMNFQNKWSLLTARWNKLMELKLNGISQDPRLMGRAMKDIKEFSDLEKGRIEDVRKEKPPEVQTKPQQQVESHTSEATKSATSPSLFDEYNKEKQRLGQTLDLDKEGFEKKLEKQKKDLLEKYKAKDVVFTVSVSDGKVTLKAKLVKK
jgi:pyruvate carboxylase